MSNKQPRPQRCEPKLYTESDMRRIQRHALMELEKHHMKLAIGSFALALHRKLGLSADQIGDVLEATNVYSHESLCFTDVQKEWHLKYHFKSDNDTCPHGVRKKKESEDSQ